MASQIVIIGGGLVGLASAYQLSRLGARVTVIEKESKVGQHQSGHNSGVLHAGLYYKPGSAKARLAVSGIRQMVAFCDEHAVPYERCGKLVVAVDPSEIPRLDTLYERGTANGLAGLERLDRAAMLEIEPHVGGIAGLRVPEEGIVDYPAVSRALARAIVDAGGTIHTGAPVTRITRTGAEVIVGAGDAAYRADFLVACAGLHADRIARMAGLDPGMRIVPFRGEYYELSAERQSLVRHLIYPVPDASFPFLGVHFTRMIRGGVEAGPNAVLALSREGYRKWQLSPRDLSDAVTYAGLWNFMRRHPSATWNELKRSYSKRLFTRSLQRLVPDIESDDLRPGGAGVRAQAMTPNGQLIEDFHFAEDATSLHVLNAPSPAATASLAIGEEIARRTLARLAG